MWLSAHREKGNKAVVFCLLFLSGSSQPLLLRRTTPRIAITRLIITLTPTLTPKIPSGSLLSDIPATVGGVKHRLCWSESTETPASHSRDNNKKPGSSSFIGCLLQQKQDEISEFLISDAFPSYPHHILFPFGTSSNTLEPFWASSDLIWSKNKNIREGSWRSLKSAAAKHISAHSLKPQQ